MYLNSMRYAMEAYETNWMPTVVANINEMEKQICVKVGCKYAFALSADNSALHLAMKLAGERCRGNRLLGLALLTDNW